MNLPNMPKMTSNKPYVVRAIYEWIIDNQMTPHLVVDVTKHNVKVPMQYAKDGQIILNISPGAALQLDMQNRYIAFRARFSGTLMEVWLPMSALSGIYAKESGMGMFFDLDTETDDDGTDGDDDGTPPAVKPPGKPKLTLVKS